MLFLTSGSTKLAGRAKYADKHENIFVPPDMTVDVWFEFWIAHIVGDLAPNLTEITVSVMSIT